jgi:hypothetical protein
MKNIICGMKGNDTAAMVMLILIITFANVAGIYYLLQDRREAGLKAAKRFVQKSKKRCYVHLGIS